MVDPSSWLKIIREVIGYSRQYSGQPIVVVIGTRVLAEEAKLFNLAMEMSLLRKIGFEFLIVQEPSAMRLDEAFAFGAYYAEKETPAKMRRNTAAGLIPIVRMSAEEAVSMEDSAVCLALKIAALKVVFVTKSHGIFDAERNLIREMDVETAKCLLTRGKGKDKPLKGEMRRILAATVKGCENGISRIHIIGAKEGALLRDLLSCEGSGTLVYSDSYQTIREAREKDLGDIFDLVKNSARNSSIVPSYLRKHRDKFKVFCVDEKVHGCFMRQESAGEGRKIVELSHLGLSPTYDNYTAVKKILNEAVSLTPPGAKIIISPAKNLVWLRLYPWAKELGFKKEANGQWTKET
ncbi:MAG: hypothetical protein PHV34_05725 [Verrucomicrobiae bacterium]|nr:hypothetical protein [Verrucomicrobiae bacterium]